ncbi:hypothetical protein [Flaviaesturariibacter aridisoli]|nr:hypothetical protein [Flaviaesturariibacter aridisoli]
MVSLLDEYLKYAYLSGHSILCHPSTKRTAMKRADGRVNHP